MTRIDLLPTRGLHERLIGRWRDDPAALAGACAEANRVLSQRGIAFEQTQPMALAPSVLLLDRADVQNLRRIAETLHGLVERAMDWVIGGTVGKRQDAASTERLARLFGDHRRMFPYLAKTRGAATWQGLSRYDAAVTADGQVKILELNTGCPAGFIHAENFSMVAREALASLAIDVPCHADRFGTIPRDALIDGLLAIERDARLEPGLAALVNDENGLRNELSLIAEAFAGRGREAAVVPANEIECRDGRAWWHQQPVSLAYNKIRISTEQSPGAKWRAGFEQRYAGFLAATRDKAMASVNNLAALTVGEDKAMLGVLRDPEFQAQLTPAERQFIDDHVQWTMRLTDCATDEQGNAVDPLPWLRHNRERLVIKPANEGRGFRVVVGRYSTEAQWEQACRVDPDLPCVVQQYAPLATLPVVDLQADPPRVVEMFLTLGLAVIRGEYQGLLARISANPVNNVGLRGMVQPVLLRA